MFTIFRTLIVKVHMIVPSDTQAAVPSFELDIKPLFRPRDINVMRSVAGLDLGLYEDVKANADRIYERLQVNMPCDGLWPAENLAKFKSWKDGGMPA
jgi:hypothetical protein